MAIHVHIQRGILSTGRTLIAAAATKIKSAALSRMAPVLLSAPSLLAKGPSIISEIPHHAYMIQNGALNVDVMSKPIAARPLYAETMSGSCLILSPSFLRHNRRR